MEIMGKQRKKTEEENSNQRILDARIETVTRVINAFTRLRDVLHAEGYLTDAILLEHELAILREDLQELTVKGTFTVISRGGEA